VLLKTFDKCWVFGENHVSSKSTMCFMMVSKKVAIMNFDNTSVAKAMRHRGIAAILHS